MAALLCAPASASASAGDVDQTPAEILSYWTDARIDSAVPGDELLARLDAPGLSDGLGLGLGAEPSTLAAAQQVGNPNKGRKRAHGKVFFTLGFSDYQCSGTVVRSKTKRLVVTAGHCAYSSADRYASNFMFIPAKDGSSEPYGRWAATRLKVTPQWEQNEKINYDVAFATMAKRNGKKLQRVVGARGVAFNRQGNQLFRAFGYPASGPSRFDGGTPFRCKAIQEGSDPRPGSPRPNRIDCDMTGGSSGGGWVISKGRVNSVVSYGYDCDPLLSIVFPCRNPEKGKLFGPYFGNVIRDLYRSEKR
ncbi:peptidase [soil metagenome]